MPYSSLELLSVSTKQFLRLILTLPLTSCVTVDINLSVPPSLLYKMDLIIVLTS